MTAAVVHLARYGLTLAITASAIFLLAASLRTLRQRRRYALHPVRGFFLLKSDAQDEARATALKLYHTTIVGWSSICDLVLREPGVRRQHAMIYLFDGDFHLRPLQRKAGLWLNGRPVERDVVLAHGDKIGVGSVVYALIDDREYAIRNPRPERFQPVDSAAAWLLSLAVLIVGATLLYLQLASQASFRRPLLYVLGAYFVAAQLVRALLSLFYRGFDPLTYQAMIWLSTIGLLLQARLTFLGRWFPAAEETAALAERISEISREFYVQGGAHILGLLLLPLVLFVAARGRLLEKLAYVAIVVTPLLYLVTFLLGRGLESHGARLWLALPGGLSLQLTEFAKLTYLFVLAFVFKNEPTFRVQLRFALWAAVNFGLIALLPDLGSIMILFPVTLIVFAVMTSEFLKTGLILAAGSIGGILAYRLMPYVQRRIYGWMSLWEEINDQNRQIVYGLQAVARGGLFGQGLGKGAPAGIPLASSDMVYAVLTEELGLIVALSVIVFFVVIWLQGASGATTARDGFTSSFLIAATSSLLMEAIVVIGGTTGLIPLTGVTLPFIAQGGSSMLAKTLLLGLLLGLLARSDQGGFRRYRRRRVTL